MRNYLQKLRTDRSMTMAEVAAKLGVSTAYYSYIENQKRQGNMKLSMIQKLATVFEVPVVEILNGETELKDKPAVPDQKRDAKADDIPTRVLTECLARRPGVYVRVADPYEDVDLSVNGPAVVLVVTD